ncbi:mug157, partial [Symbiodinium microadriaticum]
VSKAVQTIQTMQLNDGQTDDPPYLFSRYTSVSTDTLMMSGRGPPAKVNGLSRSLFRPSDDGVTLPYNIPGNAMACTELKHMQEMLQDAAVQAAAAALEVDLSALSTMLRAVTGGICTALDDVILASAASPSTLHLGVLPYEIDGYDSSYYMDDANVPSLLSLPVLGYISRSNDIYQSTRAFTLSSRNPFYFSGKDGAGVGGPHEGYNMAWPMAIITQAMTSADDDEIVACLDQLVRSADGTGFMHESFNVNDMRDYTRSWFAWANGLFGELVLQLVVERPHLVVQ